jgi:hypothetical protein
MLGKGPKMSKKIITRELIKFLKFRPFDEADFESFNGVSSPVPMIAENDDEGICMIIDGDVAELYFYDGCANFELVEICDDIRSLPYKSQVQLQLEREIAEAEASLANMKRLLEEMN